MEKPSAPGAPGIPARWTSSAKSGVGTAIGQKSRVWFTHSHGIINELYYPDVDHACTRDLGLLVSDGKGFFSDEKRHTRSQLTLPSAGAPAPRLVNSCLQGRYRIEKEIIADPSRNAVLQRIRFIPFQGSLGDYHVYALLAPHLDNQGGGNTAYVLDQNRITLLVAEREGVALAMASSAGWVKRSVGFVGTSDGWQDVSRHGEMQWEYDRAENGNVAMIGEIDLRKSGGEFVLSVGFGANAAEAGKVARAGLSHDFQLALANYVDGWKQWQNNLTHVAKGMAGRSDLFRISTTVLRTSESKTNPGGIIASLSIPWGFARGDDDLGGYHLIWPRDLVESAEALLAAGATDDAKRVLQYLKSSQLPDGHWPQNMWLNGTPYWFGIQMDETAFPILLVDLAYRQNLLNRKTVGRYWEMVRHAACYLVLNGPVTPEDRWEEDPGYSPFTLAVEIAALLAAAEFADLQGEGEFGSYLRETADYWNSNIEKWTYVKGTELAQRIGVEGYYVRIAPPEVGEATSLAKGFIPIKNRPPGQSSEPATEIISPDALSLVRFGLRAPDDPRILNMVKVVDAMLKVDTPSGPAWHRYNDDGYGEHEDGSPFDGTGVGRVWPLLTGERAHYELASGKLGDAKRLLESLESFANDGGMIPEQIWDAPDLPELELFFGRPSGSAMPLVWAHAEYIKLLRSLWDGKVYDTPPQTVKRYVVDRVDTKHAVWRFNHKCTALRKGKTLRIEVLAPAVVRWSPDGWKTIHEVPTRDLGFGLHLAELPTAAMEIGATVVLTFYWKVTANWEGSDFIVRVEEP